MQWSDQIRSQLKALPDRPGVYLMRDRRGEVVYIGKATSLRNRVRHYFQPATFRKAEPKLRGLLNSVQALEFVTVRNEAEAALTEAKLIKEYKPRYNVLMRDDKRFLLLKVNRHDPWPRFDTCRLKKNDGAVYFGPYRASGAARAALEFMDKRFGLRRCRPHEPGPRDYEHCLNDIIRFCSAPCMERIDRAAYLERVDEACAFLRGERPDILKEVRAWMQEEAEKKHYEKAAALRDLLELLHTAVKQHIRMAKTPVLKKAEAEAGLKALQEALTMPHPPALIECYDISNISGTFSVAGMVAAMDGRPAPQRYRHFRIKTVDGIDDPLSMAEVVRRRLRRGLDEQQRLPDLLLVDGGITQLRAARAVLEDLQLTGIPLAGLAKRLEELVFERDGRPQSVRFEPGSPGLHLLQQIRDEAHRFALTYHRRLRNERIRESALDDIHGIGRRKKEALLKHFGSIRRLLNADIDTLAGAPGIGPKTAELIHRRLHAESEK